MSETTLLMYTHPDIAAEWHPSNTKPVDQVTYGSREKGLWLCSKCKQSWENRVWSRAGLGVSCPYCSGRKAIKGVNDAYTLYPNVMVQLHPTKNTTIAVSELPIGSTQKLWWECNEHHTWECSLKKKIAGKTLCYYCSNKRILVGYNDLATTNPWLAAQWHPTKNGSLLPTQISKGSSRKVWWLGNCGHEWEATIASRDTYHLGCAYCSGRRMLVGFNDLETTHPEEVKYWHPTKNVLKPSEVTFSSMVKVWWIGDCGHEWEMAVGNKIRLKQSCPICSGQKVLAGFNDIATTHSWILVEWHPTKNCILPTEIGFGSEQKIWWQCQKKKNHVWQANLRNRIVLKRGCPICANRVIIVGDNDLPTTDPVLARQWHPTKNKKPATAYTAGSAAKVWWLCNKGHEWEAQIVNRYLSGHGCSECGNNGTSKVEKAFRAYFAKYLENVSPSHVTKISLPNRKRKIQIDILGIYRDKAVIIEYDGEYFHSNKIARDTELTTDFLKEGYLVIRIRECNLAKLAITNSALYQINYNWSLKLQDIEKAGRDILGWLEDTIKQG